MKKVLAILAVMLFMSLGLAAHSHAAGPMAKGGLMEYDTSKLLWAMVKTPQGEALGRIYDLEVDPHGQVILAVVIQNGDEEFPGRFIAVPFSALTISGPAPDQIHAVLNVDKEKFYTAPSFDFKDLDNRQWVDSSYRYFGQQPYWTESELGGALPMGTGGY